jgi:hypothetical protein
MYLFTDGRAPRPRVGKINMKIMGCAVACLFVFLCLVCVGGGVGVWYWKTEADKAAKEKERQQILTALNPELSSYLDIKTTLPIGGSRKFKGKVVCVDMDKKDIDADAQMALPDSLRATKPEEVVAVARLYWTEEDGGDYPDGSKARIHVVHVTLLEKKTGSMFVFRKEIRGDTEASKFGKGDRVGPMPYDKLTVLLQEYAEAN